MHETMRTGEQVRHSIHPAIEDFQFEFGDLGEKAENERDLASNLVTGHDVDTNLQIPQERLFGTHEDDPFGDEENSEVKYRTLEWWCVCTIN